MKFCIKCGKENNQNNTFCSACGNKFNNQYSNDSTNNNKTHKKTILITIIVIVLFYLLGIICLLSLLFADDDYDSIRKELSEKNLIDENLVYLDSRYDSQGALPIRDKKNRWYFYIDENNYDKYKKYWLEGIKKSEYTLGYNENLDEYGDYVFTIVNIQELFHTEDTEEGDEYQNIYLDGNTTYYLVDIYDEGIYYKVITGSAESPYDSTRYSLGDWPVNRYFVHKEKGEWIFEEWIVD